MPTSSLPAAECDSLDREAMRSLNSGDMTAFDGLMQRHGQRIYQFLTRLVGNEDDALDLAQEAFVRVYRNAARYDPAYPFRLWLYRIAGNLARNHLRWRRTRTVLTASQLADDDEATWFTEGLDPRASDPACESENAELRMAVRNAVRKLPDGMREAVVLVDLEERSLTETASILGVPLRTVESRLYRARRLLRQQLSKWLRAGACTANT